MILIRSIRRARQTVQMLQAHADAVCTHQPDNQYAARARAALSDAYANLSRAINELERGNVERIAPKPRKGITRVPR